MKVRVRVHGDNCYYNAKTEYKCVVPRRDVIQIRKYITTKENRMELYFETLVAANEDEDNFEDNLDFLIKISLPLRLPAGPVACKELNRGIIQDSLRWRFFQ